MPKDKDTEQVKNQNSIRFQVAVLKALSGTASLSRSGSKNQKKTTFTTRALKINEISELSGIKDEKETQRYLFILEGQRLVSPTPEGDLTSRNWNITQVGFQAVQQLDNVKAAA